MGEQAGSALLYFAVFSAVGAILTHSSGGHRPGAANALGTGFLTTHTVRNRVQVADQICLWRGSAHQLWDPEGKLSTS